MEKKELNDAELKSANGGSLIDDDDDYCIACPDCKYQDYTKKFYTYNIGEGCDKEIWRVCPSCQYHFRTH